MLARFRTEDFVALFEQLVTWRPVTVQHARRITKNVVRQYWVNRALSYVARGWLHGRAKLSVSEIIAAWQLHPTMRVDAGALTPVL